MSDAVFWDVSDFATSQTSCVDTERWARSQMAKHNQATSLSFLQIVIKIKKDDVDTVVGVCTNFKSNLTRIREHITKSAAATIYIDEELLEVAFIEVSKAKDPSQRTISIYISSPDAESLHNRKEGLLKFDTGDVHSENRVYMIISGVNGPTLRQVPISPLELTVDNYTPAICNDYQKIKNEILTKSPSGRLAILEGPPGTGKTSFIRGLLNENLNIRIVFLPSNMLSSLSGPTFIDLFLPDEDDVKYGSEEEAASKRTVIILEDADDALASRNPNEMSLMSNLLNLTDGILGAVADLYVIATTNTPIKDFDSALLRPGRLSVYSKFGKLDAITAMKVANRVRPGWHDDADLWNKFRLKFHKNDGIEATLAEIYGFFSSISDNGASDLLAPKTTKVGF